MLNSTEENEIKLSKEQISCTVDLYQLHSGYGNLRGLLFEGTMIELLVDPVNQF